VRRLLALRGRVPGGLHPRRRRREHARQPRLAGERYARIYEINMSRCIFCGYCELACPFDAITLGNEYEISEYNRDDQIYTKDMLLAEPIKKIPSPTRPLRHADPYYKNNS
jgi:formate hydrogenlyase subunit 6/NADH:ubiquinone oxidoreductase subunit I